MKTDAIKRRNSGWAQAPKVAGWFCSCAKTKVLVGLLLLVVLAGNASAAEAKTVFRNESATKWAVLSALPPTERAAEAAQIIKRANKAERATTTVEVVQTVVRSSPVTAGTLVGAIAKAVPEMTAMAAGAAAREQPKRAVEIVRAAVVASPTYARDVVVAVCRAAPGQYREIAEAASLVVPAATREILLAVASAIPALKPGIERAIAAAGSNPVSVPSVLDSSSVATVKSVPAAVVAAPGGDEVLPVAAVGPVPKSGPPPPPPPARRGKRNYAAP